MYCAYERYKGRRIQRFRERFGLLGIGYGHAARETGAAPCPLKASIWIFIELTLAFFSPPSIKGCQLAFYLVASNKPLCLTCIQTALHDTHSHVVISKLPDKQPLNSFSCPYSLLSVCLNCRAWKTHHCRREQLFCDSCLGLYLQEWNCDFSWLYT